MGVFYQPETEWRRRFNLDQPHFKAFPLSTALLSDPAFSSDPRTHPHFNADHSTHPPVASQRQQITRKAGMNALVRRLTTHHYLDRIDELDETDPFGASHHHDGPYEAIGNTHGQPAIPNTHSHSANTRHLKRAFNPRFLHPTHYRPTLRVPSVHGEKGLSLHLKPGQILQHNTIYTSHISTITSTPSRPAPQSKTLATIPKPDHARSHSLTNSGPHSPRHSFAHPLGDLRNRPSSFPHTSSQRYLGDNTANIPDILPLHHNNSDVAPRLRGQTEMTVFPPPRYESRLHSSGLSQSPQPAPSFSMTRKTQATESPIPALSPNRAERKYVPLLDNSHTTNSVMRSSSSIQHQSLEPPRIRHLPKRLVMPAPLQPQPTPPQPQYEFPSAEHTVLQDEYPEDRKSDEPDSDGQLVVHSQGPRLLRKKSSAFPEKMPIPYHVPMLQDDATPKIGTIPTNTESETERTKEKVRRRRLSKRKSDT